MAKKRRRNERNLKNIESKNVDEEDEESTRTTQQQQGEEKRRKLEEEMEENVGVMENKNPPNEHEEEAAMEEEAENKKKKFYDPLEWQITKRLPPRFGMAKNNVYITRKTQVAAQFKKCKRLLDRKVDQVVIHALGRAINQALKLALKLEAAMLHSIKCDVQTSSVTVTDDLTSLLDPDESTVSRERQVSAIHILLSRLE